jgi:hypothetical protein
MMSRLTQTQGKRLAELTHLLRPGWDIPGIEAAIRRAPERVSGLDVARALLNLAANPEVATPGLLPKPGRHWPVDDEGVSVLPPSNNVHCHVHPLSVLPCPQCEAERCLPDPVEHADYLAAKAALKARRPIPTEQKRLADFMPPTTSGEESS